MRKTLYILALALSLTLLFTGCANLPTTSTTYTLVCKIDKNAPKVEIYELSNNPYSTNEKKSIDYIKTHGVLVATFAPNGTNNTVENVSINKTMGFSVITYPNGIAKLGEMEFFKSSQYLHVSSDGTTMMSSIN